MSKITAKKMGMTQVWREDKVTPVTILKVGEGVTLQEGILIGIRGKTKGKGFQGVVKRHGFHGGPATHGQKHSHRAPGSIGSTGPQRVIPGRKMAGRMGGDTLTLKNIRIEGMNKEEHTLLVKGPVPGMKGTEVELVVPEDALASTEVVEEQQTEEKEVPVETKEGVSEATS